MRAEFATDLHCPYRAPFWLPGGNAQTLWPLAIKGQTPAYRRERWQTPDDDFIDLDWVDATPTDTTVPTVVLFHGLEGSSASHYARALMRAVAARRWRGVVVHFRGCSGEPNKLLRSYHSGDSNEIDWILRRLKASAICSAAPIFVAGVSLGGNALLKWLGEQGHAATGIIEAAAAISAPLDLAAASRSLATGFNRVYTKNFLMTLIPRALAKHQRFSGVIDASRLKAARSLAGRRAGGGRGCGAIAPLHQTAEREREHQRRQRRHQHQGLRPTEAVDQAQRARQHGELAERAQRHGHAERHRSLLGRQGAAHRTEDDRHGRAGQPQAHQHARCQGECGGCRWSH